MNGAESLVRTLVKEGVDVCFSNPGTSEMHFVAALDKVPGMRCVLGLFEGVVTGAADGFYRIAERPAATLLHLGPGLANGLANLHNAKKAHSGVVNIVGDHATAHLALDAPLTSDVAGLAAPMSHWVRSAASADELASLGTEAIRTAGGRPGRISTLILPANTAWSEVNPTALAGQLPHEAESAGRDESAIDKAVAALRRGKSTLLLLGANALRANVAEWAGRIAAVTGCAVMSEFYGARIERGAGRVALPRLPYAVEPSLAALAPYTHVVLVGAKPPVAFFAYPGKPGRLTSPGAECISLAEPGADMVDVVRELASGVDALHAEPAGVAGSPPTDAPAGKLDSAGIAGVLAAVLPENAIVVDESLTTGRGFDALTANAAPHDWLTGMGGSIGFGLPAALGAAVAAPDRRVFALEGDGSGMYTLQALWTMVRESLNVTVVIFANRAYQILRGEFAGVGAGEPGQRATDMLSLDRPCLDWQALARGMGMPAARVTDLEALQGRLRDSVRPPGPSLVEVWL